MEHSYNRERKMEVLIEITFEELQMIQSLAKAVAKMDELPSGVWLSDLVNLTDNLEAVITQAARDAAAHFTGIADNQ
jgi:hypothetical protein